MRALHLAGLWALAAAWPIFDFFESDPSELVAADATGLAVVVLALAILVVPPALLILAEVLVSLARRRAASAAHLVFVAGLVALYVLQARTSIALLPSGTAALCLVAAIVGGAAAAAYARWDAVRTFASVLGASPLLVAGVFLFAGPVSPLVTKGGDPAPTSSTAPDAPVVLVIFDELPVASLLDARGEIDDTRFPAFARLAGDATWVRHTTTVDGLTPWAVPAILDGRRPRPRVYSHWRFHPESIFTLFGRPGEVNAVEPLTRICPPALCPASEDGPVARGIGALHSLATPALQRLLPGRLAEPAADVTGSVLRGLGAERVPLFRERRERDVAAFVSGMRPAGLNVLHSTFPHGRWEFQRRARYALELPEPFFGASPRDRDLTELDWRMHLLQTEHADAVLGRVLDRLGELGIYDRALVVVTSDHGIAFAPGRSRREVTAQSIRELAPVPLFIKRPGQRRGGRVEAPAETIDVVPTIADVMGVELPWRADGRSVFGPARELPVARMTRMGERPVTIARAGLAPDPRAVATRIALTGDHGDRDGLFAIRGHAEAMGARVADGLPTAPAVVRREVPGPALAGARPLGIRGRVEPPGPGGRVIAIAACGRVVAVARTVREADAERFYAVRSEVTPDRCPLRFAELDRRHRPVRVLGERDSAG